jgi:hypothetical protein
MKDVKRRILLRGLGGAVVAAPFLSSLYGRSAKAAASIGAKRTIVMFTHYGCITNKWFPSKLDGELSAEDLAPTTLAPLAPFAKKLLLPRGIRTMNEWTTDNRGAGKGRGQGNDQHVQVLGSYFTCQPVTPNSNDPFSFDASTKFRAMPIGPSLDHVMAQQLSTDGVPLFMHTTGQTKEAPQTAISYSGPETAFTAVTASHAYSSLTGLFGPSDLGPDSWQMAKGKLLADIVKDDLHTLMRQDMSKADKDKLQAWLELANQVGKVLSSACNEGLATSLGASNPPGAGAGDALTRKVSDSMDNADLYSSIATLAAACNANPVIFLKYPGSFIFTGLGIDQESAGLAQRTGNASMQGPCVPDAIQNLLKIDGYYAQKFTNLVAMLDGIQGEDGTLLDDTVAVWMNQYSDGCAHNLNNAPIIQAGSGGGYFKTGRIVNLDAASGASATDMLGRSLDQCFEDPNGEANGVAQATGTDPSFGNAPVNKYFCNIMNAMGLKADAAGYPAKDGPASEVTHYGYSDKTEDFCGGAGAVTSATIHSPGGFTELKA